MPSFVKVTVALQSYYVWECDAQTDRISIKEQVGVFSYLRVLLISKFGGPWIT